MGLAAPNVFDTGLAQGAKEDTSADLSCTCSSVVLFSDKRVERLVEQTLAW